MKIRNGFVSNSSASSFLVIDKIFEEKNILTEEQVKKLIDYGFEPIDTINTLDVNLMLYYKKKYEEDINKKSEIISYAKHVFCNQDVVIEWLVKNDIPFKASCDYGHNSVIFDGKKIYSIPNFGTEAEMFGIDTLMDHKIKKNNLVELGIVKVRDKNDYGKK